MTVKFSRDYLINELDLPWANAIVDNIIDKGRWSVFHEIVFEDKGRFYRTTYSVGATEVQDESPWEYEEEVNCEEVELREVKVLKWVPVDDK